MKNTASQPPVTPPWRVVEDGVLPLVASLRKFWRREKEPPPTQQCHVEANCPNVRFLWAIQVPGLEGDVGLSERVRLWLQRNGYAPDAQELNERLQKIHDALISWQRRVRTHCVPSADRPPRLPGKLGMEYWAILDRVHAVALYLEGLGSVLKEREIASISARPASVGSEDPLKGIDKETQALAVLAQHPDWPKTRIAEAVGVHRSTLDRWPRFKTSWKYAREVSRPLRGLKTDSGIEAFDDQ